MDFKESIHKLIPAGLGYWLAHSEVYEKCIRPLTDQIFNYVSEKVQHDLLETISRIYGQFFLKYCVSIAITAIQL